MNTINFQSLRSRIGFSKQHKRRSGSMWAGLFNIQHYRGSKMTPWKFSTSPPLGFSSVRKGSPLRLNADGDYERSALWVVAMVTAPALGEWHHGRVAKTKVHSSLRTALYELQASLLGQVLVSVKMQDSQRNTITPRKVWIKGRLIHSCPGGQSTSERFFWTTDSARLRHRTMQHRALPINKQTQFSFQRVWQIAMSWIRCAKAGENKLISAVACQDQNFRTW